jgi:hypothetical protein
MRKVSQQQQTDMGEKLNKRVPGPRDQSGRTRRTRPGTCRSQSPVSCTRICIASPSQRVRSKRPRGSGGAPPVPPGRLFQAREEQEKLAQQGENSSEKLKNEPRDWPLRSRKTTLASAATHSAAWNTLTVPPSRSNAGEKPTTRAQTPIPDRICSEPSKVVANGLTQKGRRTTLEP